jgi:hypothetical protein
MTNTCKITTMLRILIREIPDGFLTSNEDFSKRYPHLGRNGQNYTFRRGFYELDMSKTPALTQ